MLGREERRQGRLCGGKPGRFGPGSVVAVPAAAGLEGVRGGCKRALRLPVWWSGEFPGCALAGQAAAGEVAQVQGGGRIAKPAKIRIRYVPAASRRGWRGYPRAQCA